MGRWRQRIAVLVAIAVTRTGSIVQHEQGPCLGVTAFVPHATPITPRARGVVRNAIATPEDGGNEAATANVKKVAVAGATGRVGCLVVRELVGRNIQVVALVRDEEKAKEEFGLDDFPQNEVTIKKCDLASEREIQSAVQGCDAAIWCATGFSDNPSQSVWRRVKNIFGMAMQPRKSIDAVAVPALAKAISPSTRGHYPKLVMLSSSGVTRPSWSEEKKAKFKNSADIPIVRLNPFGILDVKRQSEEKLRQSGVEYCILRPCGLNDKWPAGSRPIFSQGDVAVGRINRLDVAKTLVDLVQTPESVGRTVEVVGLAGYPPPTLEGIGAALARLRTDAQGPPPEEVLELSYATMQQLIPGERQDPSALALGQTYEQLDANEPGPFGRRGEENVKAVPERPPP